MKKSVKYLIIILLFVLTIILLLFYFVKLNFKNHVKNMSNKLLQFSYSLESGSYKYDFGVISTNHGNIIDAVQSINGTGEIVKDEYGNVKFYVNVSDGYCVNKTSLGNITIGKNKCDGFGNLDASILVNNSTVSFTTDDNDLYYLISKSNDLKGDWVKFNKDSAIIKNLESGSYYVWFKNDEGILSKYFNFSINCLSTTSSVYSDDILYCPLSIVSLNDEEWIVLNSTNEQITLMKKLPLDDKMSMCDFKKSSNCYYLYNDSYPYQWGNSNIFNYLNNFYYHTFSNELKNKIASVDICDDYNSLCDNELCIGMSKKNILNNNWNCGIYTNTKIRLISYDEYNYAYSFSKNNSDLLGHYWSINSFIDSHASTIQYDGKYFINDSFTKSIDVRPVITLNR